MRPKWSPTHLVAYIRPDRANVKGFKGIFAVGGWKICSPLILGGLAFNTMKPDEQMKGKTLMPKRKGNNPKRRIAPKNKIASDMLDRYADQTCYTGSPLHKRNAADYGFHPPANPRPNKSLCDGNRKVMLNEARCLFQEGINRGMVSTYSEDGLPKYVWAVDSDGRVFEAKRERNSRNYHGYELGDDEEAMRKMVLREWGFRCPAN